MSNGTQRQWQFRAAGEPRDVLKLVDNVPIPTSCKEDEVLIRVSHVALTLLYTRKIINHYGLVAPISCWRGDACVPEPEFSGVVCDLRGDNVTEFKTGDRVFGFTPMWFGNFAGNGLSEYLLIKQEYIVKVPDHLSLRDASCFSASAVTAYFCMVERWHLKEGQNVFINAGSGSVGVIAVQLARKIVGKNGKVVASCSGSKIKKVESLGADKAIDYRANKLSEYLKQHYSSDPFDFIIDIFGNDHALYANSPHYLRPDGAYYNIGIDFGSSKWSAAKRVVEFLGEMLLPTFLGGVPRTHIFASTHITKKRLLAVQQLVEEGSIKAVVDSVFQFEDALSAYDKLLDGSVTGKVLVEVKKLEKKRGFKNKKTHLKNYKQMYENTDKTYR
eukprot:TRINITY_DN740_c0_g1_i2.p1 TRINITY_DN740_c0_g1~~TRINITY_DN740_c0_g1_i2.p1  ORF type:complete len:387 (-),score=79.07 TRINITY_DN740_c0_g1_i2:110-1270(-)